MDKYMKENCPRYHHVLFPGRKTSSIQLIDTMVEVSEVLSKISSVMYHKYIFTDHVHNTREGNVFTGVCLSWQEYVGAPSPWPGR